MCYALLNTFNLNYYIDIKMIQYSVKFLLWPYACFTYYVSLHTKFVRSDTVVVKQDIIYEVFY